MKIYNLKRTQLLPISLEEAWSFFSTPKNLAKITPAKMRFTILYASGGNKTYPGQIICYEVSAIPGFKINWTSEITHVHEPNFFVDEQRSGPFTLWHHQHHFKAVPDGIEMTDEVNYTVPFGLLGRLANLLFVEREVNSIFDYRYKVLANHFSK